MVSEGVKFLGLTSLEAFKDSYYIYVFSPLAGADI